MTLIRASAPNKLHLCGEHSVVYGGKALIVPIETNSMRNVVELSDSKEPFSFTGDLGTAWFENGKKAGDPIYFPLLDVAMHICEHVNSPMPSLKAKLSYANSPKGTGNSASLSVALSLALFHYFGKEPTRQELYDAGFVGDNGYAGGKSSGGDVAAVLSNKAQLFWRVFGKDGFVKPVFKEVRQELPARTVLLLVSSDRGASKATTTEMIEVFAKNHGILKKPADLSEKERHSVCAPFDEVVDEILSLCHAGANANALGAAFDRNHALLSSVSTQGIKEALLVARNAGSLGGKLIGAGGDGGALIVLAFENDAFAIQSALNDKSFKSWPVQFAKKGPCLE